VHNGGSIGDGASRDHVAADCVVAHGRHERVPKNVQGLGVVVRNHHRKVRVANSLWTPGAGACVWNNHHVVAGVNFNIGRHCCSCRQINKSFIASIEI